MVGRDDGCTGNHGTNDLAGGMRRIPAETRAFYLVGYDPTKEPDGRFRKIHVKVNRRGVRVRARKGYYAEAARLQPPRESELMYGRPLLVTTAAWVVAVPSVAGGRRAFCGPCGV